MFLECFLLESIKINNIRKNIMLQGGKCSTQETLVKNWLENLDSMIFTIIIKQLHRKENILGN